MPFLERAREADPLVAFPCALTGFGLLSCRKIPESLRYFEDALSLEKNHPVALWGSEIALTALRRYDEGIAALQQSATLTGRAAQYIGTRGWALAVAGRTDEAREILDELHARPDSAPTAVSQVWLLAALGEIDAAFAVFDWAMDERQLKVAITGVPAFDLLRADPRFEKLVAAICRTEQNR
jgi:tetratricopeptide (TPR) repeat protein